MSTGPLVHGVVDYANAAPLVEGLPAGSLRHGVPSQLAAWLADGSVDVALLPVVELARIPGVVPVPRWGIAASGRCDSVLLFHRVPLAEIRTLVLDEASRTSSALVQVLLSHAGAGAGSVTLRSRAGGSVAQRLEGADATVIIGDAALLAEAPPGVATSDLATLWAELTGLPFVFACWATRPGCTLRAADIARLDEAAERGLARLPELARAQSARTGIAADRLLRYYELLRYRLGPDELAGLRRFLDEAHALGLVPARVAVEAA